MPAHRRVAGWAITVALMTVLGSNVTRPSVAAAGSPYPRSISQTAASGTPSAACPPVLNGDGTVTFHWCLPGATSVSVVGEWVGPIGTGTLTLSLDAATGLWSGTMALPNDLYSYTFTVSGSAGLVDPSNPPWDAEGLQSQVFVPGSNSPANPAENYGWLSPDTAVPHGSLHKHFITTPLSVGAYANGNHPLAVYTPPGYDPGCSRLYPTLYLQHGGGGNDVDWTTQGYAGIIEDNLLAEGLAQPMVIVMANFNNTARDPVTTREEDGFREDLLSAYIPFAETNYCVLKQRAGRAYAGLSQGGAYGQNIIENSADQFAYFGIWSPACIDTVHPDCGRSPTVAELSTPGPKSITRVHFGSGVNDFFGAEVTVSTEQANLAASMIPNRLHMTPIEDSPAIPVTDPGPSPNVGYERQTDHTWNSWREQLRDALTTTFFQPPPATSIPDAPAPAWLLAVAGAVAAAAGLRAGRRTRHRR